MLKASRQAGSTNMPLCTGAFLKPGPPVQQNCACHKVEPLSSNARSLLPLKWPVFQQGHVLFIHLGRIFRRPRPAANRCSSAGSPHVLSHSPPAVEQTPTAKLPLFGSLPCFVCLSLSGMAGEFQESMPGSIPGKLGSYSAPFSPSLLPKHRCVVCQMLTVPLNPVVCRVVP